MASPPQILLCFRGSELRLPPDGEIVIGRDATCDVRVRDDEGVSRRHARILCKPRGLWIEDLGSRNGVVLDGRRLGQGPEPIAPGDSFEIGRTKFELRAREATAEEGEDDAPMVRRLRTASPVPQSATRELPILGSAVPADLEARFGSSLVQVMRLCDAGEDSKARQLFLDLVDHLVLLGTAGKTPHLQAATVARLREYVARWASDAEQDPSWSRRLRAIDQAAQA